MTAKNPPSEQHTAIYLGKAIGAMDALWNHTRFLRDEAYTAHRASGYSNETGQARDVAFAFGRHVEGALQALDVARRVLAEGAVPAGDAPDEALKQGPKTETDMPLTPHDQLRSLT
jgi:hypothetical protein